MSPANDSPSAKQQLHAATSITSSILDGLRDGNNDAFLLLNDLYGPTVYRWCLAKGLSPHDACDVGQEIFQAVYRNVGQFRRKGKGSFTAWLWTITSRRTADWFRKGQRRAAAVGGTDHHGGLNQLAEECSEIATVELKQRSLSSSIGPDDILPDEESLGEVFKQALNCVRRKVKPSTLQSFWLTSMQGLSAEEAADKLGLTTNQINVNRKRIRDRLAELLSELEPDLLHRFS